VTFEIAEPNPSILRHQGPKM